MSEREHAADEAFPWDTAPTYLVRDNDGVYGCLVARETVGRRATARFVFEVDIGELLVVCVLHDEAGIQLLDGPRRREAAVRH
jgi:hypothetical protein